MSEQGKGYSRLDAIAAEIEATGTYESKDALLKVRCSESEKEAVHELAAQLCITMSELVRRFIRKGLAEYDL